VSQIEVAESEIKNNQETGVRFSTLIAITLIVIIMALLYVWSHTRMTELEYQVAEELSRKERLLEEQKRLKVEYATLKSPQRIEDIARDKLQMIYPDRNQIVIIK
jgi:cell division protein FtsL